MIKSIKKSCFHYLTFFFLILVTAFLNSCQTSQTSIVEEVGRIKKIINNSDEVNYKSINISPQDIKVLNTPHGKLIVFKVYLYRWSISPESRNSRIDIVERIYEIDPVIWNQCINEGVSIKFIESDNYSLSECGLDNGIGADLYQGSINEFVRENSPSDKIQFFNNLVTYLEKFTNTEIKKITY